MITRLDTNRPVQLQKKGKRFEVSGLTRYKKRDCTVYEGKTGFLITKLVCRHGHL